MRQAHQAWTASLAEKLPELFVDVAGDEKHGVNRQIVQSLHRLGFALVRGVGGEQDRSQVARELTEICSDLGTIVQQSPRGETVEDVRDFSDVDARDDRGYRSRGELTPHSDPPTLIALHCLQAARSGGETSIVNVRAIHDRMRDTAPELLEELFNGWPHWLVAGHSGTTTARAADSLRPIFAQQDERVSCVHYRPFLEKAAAACGTELSQRQVAALDLFDDLANSPELNLRFYLKPGETMLLHNRTVLHARTDYEDWPEPARRRHLLRLWIDAPELLPVAPEHELGDLFAAA